MLTIFLNQFQILKGETLKIFFVMVEKVLTKIFIHDKVSKIIKISIEFKSFTQLINGL